MKPRADFLCLGCQEGHSNLPVTATVCPDPECGGELQRLWNQAPGVITSQTKIVDQVVGPEYERNRAHKTSTPPERRPVAMDGKAVLGALSGEAKLWSNLTGVAALNQAKKIGGPLPIYTKQG